MRVRWLGWAGVEVQAEGESVVVDPLQDAGAVFAALGERAQQTLPQVVPALAQGSARAGLVTHLHRDHTDAAALTAALAPDAEVWAPPAAGGAEAENLGLAQALAELEARSIEPRQSAPWSAGVAGPFALTALPAVDGLGDPQVSWLIDAGGRRVLHLGDTVFHGALWRIAQRHGPFDAVFVPINGAAVDFPHRQPPSPLPVVLDPEQAALAAAMLRARVAVPIHYGGYVVPPWYRPAEDALERFQRACAEHGLQVRVLEPGESFEL
ncbi:MAG TPA: MBL fold metallo-hydrolase [Solirubrobacteraceae bacterium]|jgi:L-ascorbate metabolism protein UlaG (beta-lactamase superfamily)